MYFSLLIVDKGSTLGLSVTGKGGQDLVSVLVWRWVSDGEGALWVRVVGDCKSKK